MSFFKPLSVFLDDYYSWNSDLKNRHTLHEAKTLAFTVPCATGNENKLNVILNNSLK